MNRAEQLAIDKKLGIKTADINRTFALRVIKSNPHTAAILAEALELLRQAVTQCACPMRGVNHSPDCFVPTAERLIAELGGAL